MAWHERLDAVTDYGGGVVLHNQGCYRLSHAGFGSSTNAFLIDWLSHLQPQVLGQKVDEAETTPNIKPRGKE